MNEMQQLKCALPGCCAKSALQKYAKALSEHGLQNQEGPTISHHTSYISIFTSAGWSILRFI